MDSLCLRLNMLRWLEMYRLHSAVLTESRDMNATLHKNMCLCLCLCHVQYIMLSGKEMDNVELRIMKAAKRIRCWYSFEAGVPLINKRNSTKIITDVAGKIHTKILKMKKSLNFETVSFVYKLFRYNPISVAKFIFLLFCKRMDQN